MATYKVVDADKLDTDLKAVADSIRAKGGTTENLDFPADFVSAVENIETGGEAKEEQEKTVDVTENGTTEVFADEGKTMSKVTVNTNVASEGDIGKPYIDTSKITNFSRFFASSRLVDQINNVDVSNGTDFSSAFEGNYSLSIPISLDTRQGGLFNYMFSACWSIPSISIDTKNGSSFSGIFSSCRNLETVSITTARNNFSTDSFQSCTALKNITIGDGWSVNIYLHYSNNLTVESLHGMIENLADLTGKTAKTFQVGATNLAKIDAEHLTMLQNKNWNYS